MRRAAPLLAVALLAVGCAGCGSSRVSSISVDRFVNASTPPRILRDRIAAPDWLYFASVDHGWMGFQKHTYETRDGGKNWHEVKSRPSVPSAPSKPSGICGRADVESVSFWSAENGYALCGVFGYTTGVYPQYENSLWQTSDAGASWHRCEKCRLGGLATTFTPEEEGASPSLQIQFFDRDHGLISPGLGASDYVTSETDQRVGIFATSDGGASWRPVGFGTLGRSSSWPDWRDGFSASPSGFLGNGSTNGLYATHDAGASWRKIWPAPVRPSDAISYSSPRVAIGAGSPWGAGVYGEDSRAVLRSADGGLHWRPWGTIPTKGVVCRLVRLSARNVLAVSNEPKAGIASRHALFRSDDNGRSWQKLSMPKPAYLLDDACFYDGQISFSGADGYAAGWSGGVKQPLFVTHDGGRSWKKYEFEKYKSESPPGFESIAALSGKRLLAVDRKSSKLRAGVTRDNGPDSWIPVPPSFSISRDGGRSWRSIPLFVRGKQVTDGGEYRIIFSDPKHLWIKDESPDSDRIFMSSDGGKSWHGISLRGRLGVSYGGLETDLSEVHLSFVSPKLGFLDFGPTRQQLMTRDGGRTWTGLPFKPVRPSLGF